MAVTLISEAGFINWWWSSLTLL